MPRIRAEIEVDYDWQDYDQLSKVDQAAVGMALAKKLYQSIGEHINQKGMLAVHLIRDSSFCVTGGGKPE